MSNEMIVTVNRALDRLNKSLEKSSLDDLVKARTRRSLLLVDCSASMRTGLRTGERRIDALRKIVADLRETHPVPVAAFPQIELVDSVPEPRGSTTLHAAIDYATSQGANHLVVVTDGEPDSQEAAFEAAVRFGGTIDVFFVGDAGDFGFKFAAELARRTGGQANNADLGEPKALRAGIVGLLGDGSDSL